jgi:hypothetical protein
VRTGNPVAARTQSHRLLYLRPTTLQPSYFARRQLHGFGAVLTDLLTTFGTWWTEPMAFTQCPAV